MSMLRVPRVQLEKHGLFELQVGVGLCLPLGVSSAGTLRAAGLKDGRIRVAEGTPGLWGSHTDKEKGVVKAGSRVSP